MIQGITFKDFDDLIQAAISKNTILKSRNDLIKREKDYLETLIDIERKFGDNPKKFTKEVKAFISYWGDCCDSYEGDIINYKENGDDYFPCSSDSCEDSGPGGYSPVD